MKNLNKFFLVFFLIIISTNYSCKKFLEIDPPKDAATLPQIFENDEIATSAITGIYSRMAASRGYSGDQNSITVLGGLSADELKSYSTSLNGFYHNEIPTSDAIVAVLWSDSFAYIYTTNVILNGLKQANGVTSNTKNQLEGEAKFTRAFCYFYLVNLFGDVPLALDPDYRVNELAPRSSKEKIYSQIISDLRDAENLLSSNYVTTERVRPTKWAAKALLSRVYLYLRQWELAIEKTTEIINQTATFELLPNLDQVFLKNSKEAIWQLMPPTGNNTKEGSIFILTATPINVSLSPDIIPFFVNGDNRRVKWINEFSNNTGKYYYPFKYKVKTTTTSTGIAEYSTVIRLAEIYLIRSEARANLNLPDLALEDINIIRKRAGLVMPLSGLTSIQCIAEIEKQRRLELFSEWGHRWLDLKRTGRAPSVLGSLKGSTWQDTDVLFPIPDSERERNPIVGQNLGY